MNVYDFDKTIYKEDSTENFVFFCLKKQPLVLLHLPVVIVYGSLFLIKVIDKTSFKEKLYGYFKYIKNIDELLDEFVSDNIHKIQPWYLEQKQDDDLIISASPEFLVRKFLDKINVKNLIASRVDKQTGKYTGLNCYHEEKVVRYKEIYNDTIVDEFYSDSLSDTPMAKIAKKAYFVSDGVVTDWKF